MTYPDRQRENNLPRPWDKLDPPVWWEAIKDFVIADRHLPDGTRQHMVRGNVAPGLVVNNAQVIVEDDLTV